MLHTFLDILSDAAVDTVKLIPFLFVTYWLMEYFEGKAASRSTRLLLRVGPFGPAAGAAVGVIPQCGFSAAAASLYAGGLISTGTLLSVFLSTSDEMLPIFLSEHVAAGTLGRVLLAKAVIGVLTGMAVDGVLRLRRYGDDKHIHDLCDNEHCGCEDEAEPAGLRAVTRSALVHTLNITAFVFAISLVLGALIDWAGVGTIESVLTDRPVVGVCLSALIGLIPNCAASVTITQLYLSRMLTAGQMMAGLLVGAGVGLLVLFRTSRHWKENLKFTVLLYVRGVAWGLLFELLHLSF